jgi:hypothetical protein
MLVPQLLVTTLLVATLRRAACVDAATLRHALRRASGLYPRASGFARQMYVLSGWLATIWATAQVGDTQRRSNERSDDSDSFYKSVPECSQRETRLPLRRAVKSHLCTVCAVASPAEGYQSIKIRASRPLKSSPFCSITKNSAGTCSPEAHRQSLGTVRHSPAQRARMRAGGCFCGILLLACCNLGGRFNRGDRPAARVPRGGRLSSAARDNPHSGQIHCRHLRMRGCIGVLMRPHICLRQPMYPYYPCHRLRRTRSCRFHTSTTAFGPRRHRTA